MEVLPKRREGFVVEDLPEATILYDRKTYRAHHLNRTASLVWRFCDGRTTTEEMAKILERELNTSAGEEDDAKIRYLPTQQQAQLNAVHFGAKLNV